MSLTILNKNSLMLGPRGGAHEDLHILYTGRLSSWPVYSGGSWACRYVCQIQFQVPDLSEEHVCWNPSLVAIILILVSINQAKSSKSSRGFDYWHRIWIANYLGKVVVNDWWRDQICPSWEVYNSWSRCRGLPTCWPESTTSTDGRIDCSCIIGHTITYSG